MGKHFVRSFAAQDKLAEFFDVSPGSGETLQQFRQKLVSTTEYYNNNNDRSKEVKEYTKTTENINKVSYKIVGYDESLQKYMASKSLKVPAIPMNTERTAIKLFKRKSNFIKENLPEKFVDAFGNVWQKFIK